MRRPYTHMMAVAVVSCRGPSIRRSVPVRTQSRTMANTTARTVNVLPAQKTNIHLMSSAFISRSGAAECEACGRESRR